MDKVQQIRAEIEKKRQAIRPSNTGQMKVVDVPKPLEQGWLNALKWMEDVIDSLSEEQFKRDMNNEDIDTLENEYLNTIPKY